MSRILDYLSSLRTLVGISRIGTWLLFGSLIGVIAGTGAILFTYGIQFFADLFYETIAGYHIPSLGSESSGGGPVAGSGTVGFMREKNLASVYDQILLKAKKTTDM